MVENNHREQTERLASLKPVIYEKLARWRYAFNVECNDIRVKYVAEIADRHLTSIMLREDMDDKADAVV